VYINSGASRTITWSTAWGTVTPIGTPYYLSDVGIAFAHVENCNAASSTGSVTASGACVAIGLSVREASGIALTGAYLAESGVNKQVNPGTGAGAITASVTPGVQPAYLDGLHWARNLALWNTAVSDTVETAVWNDSGVPQHARVTSAAARAMTATTNNGTDDWYSLVIAFKEATAAAGILKQVAGNYYS